MTSRATIHVRFDHPGMHLWKDAPPHRAYLAFPHRHLFKVEVSTKVAHDDRHIEFHDLTEVAREEFASGFNAESLGRSCEHMARALARSLAERYHQPFTVSVWEDGEFGSTADSE